MALNYDLEFVDRIPGKSFTRDFLLPTSGSIKLSYSDRKSRLERGNAFGDDTATTPNDLAFNVYLDMLSSPPCSASAIFKYDIDDVKFEYDSIRSARSFDFHEDLSPKFNKNFYERNDLTEEERRFYCYSLLARETMSRSLADYADFVILAHRTKFPASNAYKKHRKRTPGVPDSVYNSESYTMEVKTPPMSGSYGIRPRTGSRLYIIDIDLPKDLKAFGHEGKMLERKAYLDSAMSTLSKKLGVNLYDTIAQFTPSGGLHLFLLLPEGIDPATLPFASMKDYALIQKDSEVEILGDFRSGAGICHVVGPGSEILPAYRLGKNKKASINDSDSEEFLLNDDILGLQVNSPNAPLHEQSHDNLGLDMAKDSNLGLKNHEVLPYFFASYFDDRFKDFRIGRKIGLKTISQRGVKWLQKVKAVRENEKAAKRATSKVLSTTFQKKKANRFDRVPVARLMEEYDARLMLELEGPNETINAITGNCLSPLQNETLDARLMDLALEPYHQRRAYVYRGLSCCHSYENIAELIIEKDLHRDSSKPNFTMGKRAIIRDLIRFQEIYPKAESHGYYCGRQILATDRPGVNASTKGFSRLHWYSQATTKYPEMDVKQLATLRKSEGKISYFRNRDNRFRSRNARGVDLTYAARVIFDEGKSARFQNRRDALYLLANYFGPLANVGNDKALGSHEYLVETYGLSSSRVTHALRVLRKFGVLKLVMKQATGMAPLYRVTDRFISKALTTAIRNTWGASMILDHRQRKHYIGSVFNHRTGALQRLNGESFHSAMLDDYALEFSLLLAEYQVDHPTFDNGMAAVKVYLEDATESYEYAKNSQDRQYLYGQSLEAKVLFTKLRLHGLETARTAVRQNFTMTLMALSPQEVSSVRTAFREANSERRLRVKIDKIKNDELSGSDPPLE